MGTHGAESAEDRVAAAVSDYLDDLAARTHDRLGQVAGVAITMAIEGGPITAGASTQLVRTVDALQYAIGTGPCLNALAGHGGDYVRDLGADDRWGDYGPRAASWGVRCCLSVPVHASDTVGIEVDDPGRVLAVAKIYATDVDGLDAEQRRRGEELAAEVAAGLRLVQTLRENAAELDDRVQAMNNRRTIDLAVGILMERATCDADQAFSLIRRFSQTRNVALRDVARDLVAGSPGTSATAAPQPASVVLGELLDTARSAEKAPFLPRGSAPAR